MKPVPKGLNQTIGKPKINSRYFNYNIFSYKGFHLKKTNVFILFSKESMNLLCKLSTTTT